jgi:hypothetical protein
MDTENATVEELCERVRQVEATVAGFAAELREVRADASQDALELRARTRWLDGRIEALEAAPDPQPAAVPVAAARARRKRGAAEKSRPAARAVKAELSPEEIERIRAEKRARRQ